MGEKTRAVAFTHQEIAEAGTVVLLGGSSSTVTLGAALYPVAGSDLVRLLQTLPPGLGAVTSFSEDPTLGLLPTLPPGLTHALPTLVQLEGNASAFVVAGLATVALVLGARGFARRRDQQSLERF